MGYDLYREGDYVGEHTYYRWNIWGFPPVKYLAELYGWKPMGTVIKAWTDDDGKEHLESACSYDTNDGQVVNEQDAANWATALSLAIEDIKKRPSVKEDSKSNKIDDAYMEKRRLIHQGHAQTLLDEFNTESELTYLENFVVFLNEGEFQIY